MKTKLEWEEDIIELSTKINSEFPELAKYIDEIPLVETKSNDVNLKNLKEYYRSLQNILTRYSKTHM